MSDTTLPTQPTDPNIPVTPNPLAVEPVSAAPLPPAVGKTALPVQDMIRQIASQAGENPEYYLRMAQIESGMGTNKVSASSRARGLFQFMPDTWKGFGSGDVMDDEANMRAAIRLTQANRNHLRAQLGRDPLDWELYMAHQQGAGGGSGILKNPDKYARDIVGEGAVTNNGGTAEMLAADFSKLWQNKWMNTKVRTQPGDPIKAATAVFDAPKWDQSASYTAAQRAVYEQQHNETQAGFWSTLGDQYTTQTTTARLLSQAPFLEAQPGFAVTPKMLEDTKLPEHYLNRFASAVSQDHFDHINNIAQHDYQSAQMVEQAGLKGAAAVMLADALDPVTLAMTVGTGGIGYGMKAGRAVQAGTAAAVSMGLEGVHSALKEEKATVGQYAFAAATGAALGALFGPMGKNPNTAPLAAELHDVAMAERARHIDPVEPTAEQVAHVDTVKTHHDFNVGADAIPGMVKAANDVPLSADLHEALRDPYTSPKFGVALDGVKKEFSEPAPRPTNDNGARVVPDNDLFGQHVTFSEDGIPRPHDVPMASEAGDLSAARNLDVEQQRLTDAELRSVQDESVPRSVFARAGGKPIRWDVAGIVGNSDNPLVRMVGSLLFSDKVGKAGHATNAFSADEATKLYHTRTAVQWRQTLLPAFQEWAKDQGQGTLARAFRKGWHEFNSDISEYVWNRDATREFHPSVVRAGEELRRQMKVMSEDQRNPMGYVGREGRPIAGAEFLEHDPNYLPHVWNPAKITKAIQDFGIGKVRATVAGAVKRAQPSIDDDLVTKFADAILESRYTKLMGYDDRLSRILGNADQEVLRTALTKEFHWEGADVQRLLDQLNRGKPTTASAHLKQRIKLDELHVHPDGDLALKDLLETSADSLFHNYSRNVAGRVSLARQQFVDPRNGSVIVDGITSEADFQRLLNAADKLGRDLGHEPEAIRKDIDRLKWGYDRIRGIPDNSQLGDIAQWMRLIRSYNFATKMGALGIATVMDSGRVIGELGLMGVIQHSSGFRRMMSADGKWVRSTGLDRELEAALGLGADRLRAVQTMIIDDVAGMHGFNGNRLVDKLNVGAEYMANTVAEFSGFHWLQAKLHMTTAKGLAQKFTDLAMAGKVGQADLIRLKFGGLDEPMLKRIFGEIKANAETSDGVLFKGTVNKMNLDKWKDLEAVAAFNNALFRLSRSIVQENDIGAMHTFFSSAYAQSILQFRSFAMTAWTNQLLQGIHRGDSRALMNFLWSTFTGGAVYVAQTHLNAMGRSDADKFLADRMEPSKLALNVFQRAGFSSIIPMAVDTGWMLFNDQPLFNGSTSSRPTDAIFGNPTIGALTDLAKGSRAVVDTAYRGKPWTQDDSRALARLLPLNNAVPIGNAISSAISSQPLKNIR